MVWFVKFGLNVLVGAWLMHPLLIISGKFFIDMIPGISTEMSWTITNVAYMVVCFSRAYISHVRFYELDSFRI